MRLDHLLIYRAIKPDSKVLDIGCGNGDLLLFLKKKVNGKGIDIKEEKVIKCIEKGLSVVQSDVDNGLRDYKDGSFDYVILNDTLQTVKYPVNVLREAARVGKKVIVTFPNFAHYSIRFNLILKGKMPKSKTLPYEWYNTPNIHLFTIKDFYSLCFENRLKIINCICFNKTVSRRLLFHNFFARNALFILEK